MGGCEDLGKNVKVYIKQRCVYFWLCIYTKALKILGALGIRVLMWDFFYHSAKLVICVNHKYFTFTLSRVLKPREFFITRDY